MKFTKIDAQCVNGFYKEISEDTYSEMLEVLPPAFWKGGLFLVGECIDHDSKGVAIYQAFNMYKNQYYSCGDMTIKKASELSDDADMLYASNLAHGAYWDKVSDASAILISIAESGQPVRIM